MFSEHKFSACFPTGIWSMTVDRATTLNQKLLTIVQQLRISETWLPNENVEDPGYGQQAQSFANLHHREDFAEFTKVALSAGRSVLDFLKYKYTDCYITDCWANICRKGESHRAHIHPNNIISGVYYAAAPQGCGDIVFDDPRAQAKVLIPDILDHTALNTHEFRVEPADGMVILFPSWLNHRVAVSQSSQERVSISFNIMLRGDIGFEKASAKL